MIDRTLLTEALDFASAVEAWQTFPSDYEVALLDQWLKSHLGGEHDYEARLALAVYAQREKLARLLLDFPTDQQVEVGGDYIGNHDDARTLLETVRDTMIGDE